MMNLGAFGREPMVFSAALQCIMYCIGTIQASGTSISYSRDVEQGIKPHDPHGLWGAGNTLSYSLISYGTLFAPVFPPLVQPHERTRTALFIAVDASTLHARFVSASSHHHQFTALHPFRDTRLFLVFLTAPSCVQSWHRPSAWSPLLSLCSCHLAPASPPASLTHQPTVLIMGLP